MTAFELEYSMDCSVNCICNKCNTELDIQSVDASFSSDITVRVEPCARCNGIEIDTQSEFFKDLLEYVEKEFGREAALRIELFGLTYHPITRK